MRFFVAGDIMAGRGVLIVPDEFLDGALERGREQHGLAVAPRAVDEPAHARKESHVGHAIRLVDHHQGRVGQVDIALLDQILEPSGAGDQHFHTPAEGGTLLAVAHPAVHGGDLGAYSRRKRHQNFLHLGGQLSRRHQDQGIGPALVATRARSLRPSWDGSRASTPRPKARVLPDPVGALPHTSRPASRLGSVATWIGNGIRMPSRSSTATRAGGTPRAANDWTRRALQARPDRDE